MKLAEPFDFSQYEIRNAVIHVVPSFPSAPKLGQVAYNTGTLIPATWNGSAWRPLDAAALTDGSIAIAALAVNPLLRANHSGVQPSATISDLATTVKAYTLDSFAAAVAAVNVGGQRLTNVAQGTNATDVVTLAQAQALATAAAQGQTKLKDPVRAYAASNITLSGLFTLDGVVLAAGDRVLAANQSTAVQSNIYVAATGAWSIAADCNTGVDWIQGSDVLVDEGTQYGGAIFRQQTSGTITIGTTALTWTQTSKINNYVGDGVTATIVGRTISVNVGPGLTTAAGNVAIDTTIIGRKYSTTITGDGSTTSFQITHNLGTTDVIVGCRDSTGTVIFPDDAPTSTSAVTVSFGTAPATGVTYRITVIG